MIEQIVAGCVRHRRATLWVTALLLLIAAVIAGRLQLDALPDVTSNQVLVLTRAPGLTPEEVERRVTRPLESVLGGLPGLVEHRSLSRYGISAITAVFEDDVETWRARQLVQERLQVGAGELPPGVAAPELGPVTGGLGEIFHFTLRSAHRTPAELLELASYRIAPLLRAVPGVIEVNTWGGRSRRLEVVADPVRMASHGLTLDQLRTALERASGTAPGASLPAGAGQALVRAVALPRSATELGLAVVRSGPDGAVVRLADVAQIREGDPPRIGAATQDGRGEVVYLMAQMLRGANALEVMSRLHDQMPSVQAVLPEDVQVELVYDRSQLVQATLRTVGRNLAEGGVLVIIVLLLMLGSLRAGLLVAAVIPAAMLVAVVGMVLFGIPGNLMSLGAIDFGLVVDGAVVIVEHLFHVIQHAPPDADPRRPLGARVGPMARSVARPVFFSVLVILLVYLPVLSLTGVDGKMFRPMALTVVFALLGALVLSLTVVPAAAATWLRPVDVPRREPLLVRGLQRGYEPLLQWTGRHPALVATGALLLLALGGWLYARAGSEFAPQLDEGDLVVQTTRDPDISLERAVVEAGRLERVLRERVPEVLHVVSRVGSPAVATDIMGIEQADVFVKLRPRDQWRPGLTRDALLAEMSELLAREAPGGEPSFTQPIQMRFNELLGGTVTDVSIGVHGDDLTQLRQLAEQLQRVVAEQPGAVDVRVLAPPDVALAEVRPRPLEAAQLGFDVADQLDSVQALRQGLEVGATYDGLVRVPIVLRLGGPASLFDLQAVPLAHESGAVVPLSRVADVIVLRAPSLVAHLNGQRRLLVGFNVRGADLGAVVAGAQERVARSMTLPKGYRLEWGGQYATLQDASRRLALVVPAVLVLIIGVLLAAFGRARPALLIFTNVPFACVGGMAALSMRDMPVSISAAIGFIALSGVAVLNGVVLMTQLQRNEQEGMSALEAALTAARSRARPVLMTALVAALGFVPMMFAHGTGAEVQRPLATVVVGGLVTSTILTLLILPALYPWFAGRARRGSGAFRL